MSVCQCTGPRVPYSLLTKFTVLSVLCVRTTDAVSSVVSSHQASTSSCQVRFTLYTLHYHVKPQPCHVKPRLGWVKHHAYHDKFS
ncbi:uncharacterized protein HD556DRAFT_1415572 [Suillus plorans]|uniref:Secreted protein n=1 Tax=Suillus plorans TaxID=116603 RepID=A0A9P7DBQ7_9AGAM|nr:uncharacterized protein HD556DRAFT_1415572 [Suillus plorans]KAG1786361.1 hypothetical protein HD556DRAFT_1415572 [Suillus plorans]